VSANLYHIGRDEKHRCAFSSTEIYINAYITKIISETENIIDSLSPIMDMICLDKNITKCNIGGRIVYLDNQISLTNFDVSNYDHSLLYLALKHDNSPMLSFGRQIHSGVIVDPIEFYTGITTPIIFRYLKRLSYNLKNILFEGYFDFNDAPPKRQILLRVQYFLKTKDFEKINMLYTDIDKSLWYPLTNIGNNEYNEGFWFSDKEQIYPIPKIEKISIDETFISDFKLVTKNLKLNNMYTPYFGVSSCRFTNINISGNKTYHLKYGIDMFNYPEGLIYYYNNFNVQPSDKFKTAIKETAITIRDNDDIKKRIDMMDDDDDIKLMDDIMKGTVDPDIASE